ncbi:MAG TPA: HAD family hydrolase [Acidimicrobiales bacterium]|nr:HAD family hydrolase [Acidimicrobiales bacterium]
MLAPTDGRQVDLTAVRIVATDMDGTLLDPRGAVSERTAAAVAAARDAGIHVIPVTGRPPQALWDLAERAGLGPLGVCANGAAIVDLEQQTVIEVEHMPGSVAAGLVELVKAAVPGIKMAADDLDCFSYESGFFEMAVDWQEKLVEVHDIAGVVGAGCIKLIARSTGTTAAALIEVVAAAVGEIGHVTSSGLDWVDIGAPGVSKAAAVVRVCEHLGEPTAGVLAIGDNHNDIPLLSWAAHAMAPANAIPEVVAVAHRVLPANTDDGVATLLEELVAGRSEELVAGRSGARAGVGEVRTGRGANG